MYRSSHRRCSVRKRGFRNLAKFTGKSLCQSLFFNKVAGRPATLLEKKLWHRCFPVNFAKFLRTPFLQNTCGRLLLNVKHRQSGLNGLFLILFNELILGQDTVVDFIKCLFILQDICNLCNYG